MRRKCVKLLLFGGILLSLSACGKDENSKSDIKKAIKESEKYEIQANPDGDDGRVNVDSNEEKDSEDIGQREDGLMDDEVNANEEEEQEADTQTEEEKKSKQENDPNNVFETDYGDTELDGYIIENGMDSLPDPPENDEDDIWLNSTQD